MIKVFLISILINISSIQQLNAACFDTELYCFDINNQRIGKISVGQCWIWSRVNCLPCSANTMEKKINFGKYIHHCRYFYPDTVLVLDTKKVWTHQLLNANHGIAYG